MARSVERPNRYFTFLRRLRAEGRSNMYGAIPYLAAAFGIDRSESFRIICEWIDSQETVADLPVRKSVARMQPADAPTLFDPPAPPDVPLPAAPKPRRPVKARAAPPRKPRKPSDSRAA